MDFPAMGLITKDWQRRGVEGHFQCALAVRWLWFVAQF
jgi:hypothetical protein